MLILEQIMHSKKLSYDALFPIMQPYMRDNSIDTVNIFIDFWDVVKSIYKPEVIETLNSLKTMDRFLISSETINMVGHYRHFFASRARKFSNIIIYYSDQPDSYLQELYPEYRNEFYSKRLGETNSVTQTLNRIIKHNVQITKVFCEYVPHVYFINSGDLNHSIVPSLFLRKDSPLEQPVINSDNQLSIIISNEKIHYQDLSLNDKILQLELRGKEKSRVVASEDIISIMKAKSKKEYNFSILPEMTPVLNALTGYKNYDIPSVKKTGDIKALTLVQKLIDESRISNIRYDNLDWINELSNEKGFTPEHLDEVERNFKLLNHTFYPIKTNQVINIQNQLIERIDAKAVRYVNDQYFKQYPILIDFVFEGEEYE